MDNLPISETASFPAQQRAYETGDTAATGTLELPFEDTAAALGFLKARVSGGRRALHGKLTTNGAGGVAINGGSGLYTAAISGSKVRITFDSVKASAHYSVFIQPASGNAEVGDASASGMTTTTADLGIRETTAGTLVDLSGNARTFYFEIKDAE